MVKERQGKGMANVIHRIGPFEVKVKQIGNEAYPYAVYCGEVDYPWYLGTQKLLDVYRTRKEALYAAKALAGIVSFVSCAISNRPK